MYIINITSKRNTLYTCIFYYFNNNNNSIYIYVIKTIENPVIIFETNAFVVLLTTYTNTHFFFIEQIVSIL